MAEYYFIQIEDIFLTRSGNEVDNDPCELFITGASDLLNPFSGNVTLSIDGTPIIQIFETGTKGKVLELKVTKLYAAVWTSLVNLINTALSEEETLNIVGIGDIGNFNANVFPLIPKPYEATEFIEGRIYNATFRFITT